MTKFAGAIAGKIVLALALTCALLAPTVAFAATTELENEVNPHQLQDSSFIYDTSIAELAGADSYLDGQTVQVVGEVVGDNLSANIDGSYRWIALMADDGSGAIITVHMSKSAAALIDTFGRYGATGTILQVRGTFNLACPEHEGLSDLHANSVSVMHKGVVHEDVFDVRKFIPGIAFAALGLILTMAFYFARERQR